MEAMIAALGKPKDAILGKGMLKESHLAVNSRELDIHSNRRISEAKIVVRGPGGNQRTRFSVEEIRLPYSTRTESHSAVRGQRCSADSVFRRPITRIEQGEALWRSGTFGAFGF
jgi:hypothetical protein